MGKTTSEKILARASGQESVSAGDIIWANVDRAMMDDILGPRVQGADHLAGIFHGLVCRARVADHTDGLERDVLGHHASGQRSLP